MDYKKYFKERNGLSIAANAELSWNDAKKKLIQKYGIDDHYHLGTRNVDGEKMSIHRVNHQYYGLGVDGTVWNIDEIPDKVETKAEYAYQVNSKTDDQKMIEFVKGIDYLYSDDYAQYKYKAAENKKELDKAELARAKQLIQVKIIGAKFRTPEDFADEVEDESWSGFDEDAEFQIEISFGNQKIFTGYAYPILTFKGSADVHYTPGRMYLSNGDPGYPDEWYGTVTVEFDGIDSEYPTFLQDKDRNDVDISELAALIPGKRFQDLFRKTYLTIINDAIEDHVAQEGDYEGDL